MLPSLPELPPAQEVPWDLGILGSHLIPRDLLDREAHYFHPFLMVQADQLDLQDPLAPSLQTSLLVRGLLEAPEDPAPPEDQGFLWLHPCLGFQEVLVLQGYRPFH